jgi:Secretion system C-terminal sorting domain
MDDKNQRYSIQNISGLSFNNFVNPLQTTTYTLKTISSQCGYGIAKGSVKVIVKPNAKLNINNSNFITACIGDEVTLNLISFGTFEKDNKFSIVVYDDSTKKKEILSTPEAGSFKVKLPSDLQIGTYQVELSSSNPVSKKIVQSINITSSPEAILSGGGAIINAGERVNLLCTINPSQKTYIYENIQYQLSDTTSGTIYNQGKNYIQTKPLYSSKTFTLTSVRNICGAGKVSGSVKIEVNPPSAKQVNIDNYYTNYSYFCEGAEAYIYFTTKGNFTTNNKFTVQLSDAKGENFKDIKTEGNSNPLKALIPADLPVGAEYRFRIVASDKDVTSTTNLYPLEIRKGVTARFDTTAYYFEPNKPVTVKIIFTGTAPYGFTLGSDEINAKQFNANSSPYLLTVNPISSVSYKIFRVANSECGIGTILPQNTVTLQLITSIEELSEMGINVFPNPTSDILKIESNGKTEITLFDIAGKTMLAKSFNSSNEELNLQNLPTGQYLLRVQKGNKMATFKVMKN